MKYQNKTLMEEADCCDHCYFMEKGELIRKVAVARS